MAALHNGHYIFSSFLWPPCVADADIIFLPCGFFFFLLLLLFPCPHNMANFGPLAAKIGSEVWGTPANFNAFASWQRYCTPLW